MCVCVCSHVRRGLGESCPTQAQAQARPKRQSRAHLPMSSFAGSSQSLSQTYQSSFAGSTSLRTRTIMTVPNEVMELHGKTEVERAVLLYSPGHTRHASTTARTVTHADASASTRVSPLQLAPHVGKWARGQGTQFGKNILCGSTCSGGSSSGRQRVCSGGRAGQNSTR